MAYVGFLQLDSCNIVPHVHLKIWVVYHRHGVSTGFLAIEYPGTRVKND